MKLSFDNYMTLAKIGAVVIAGLYVYRRGAVGVVSDAVGGAISGGGVIIYNAAKPIVYQATKSSALNVRETVNSFQKDLGVTEDQALWLEMLALGNMGA